MELIDTSINNLSNQNEDLTPTEGNKQQKIDLSQFFIEKMVKVNHLEKHS